ncbi:pentapeptide repeat-containing protein [Methyloglobulus sp.]|uniref:pentapeptide repeat-containing protein n=1 Tax=Methyloglobulus sp. TaxID=2518622 RepID=UPI0032B78C59
MTAPNKALIPGRARQTKADELARLDKIVENSSEKNRNFFIVYLGLLVYVQAIIFSTTDLQLLVSTDGLKLPLIDLNVPLVGFYVVVPIFIIALHFNFLQNLESHHYKLMQWQAAHMGGQVPRKFIYPFLFDYAILEQGSQFQRLVKIANSLLCYNLAPITLGLLLIRFSDRQDFMVTAWHYLLFVIDSYLVWKFSVAVRENGQPNSKNKSTYRWPQKAWYFLRDSFRYGLHGVFGLLILLETVLTGLIGGTSSEFFVEEVQSWLQPIAYKNYIYKYGHKEITLLIAHQLLDRPIEWLLPRISINPTDSVWKHDVIALQTQAKLAGQTDWVKYFNEQGKGFRPALDSLRFSILQDQNLPRSQLSNFKLEGANLNGAQLQGSNLKNAYLHGVHLDYAQLENADLEGAQLEFSDLSDARLQGANLQYTILRSANLSGVDLRFSFLNMTQLQDALLSLAVLIGATLDHVNLAGVDLSSAYLIGADLNGANLTGADLGNAQLQGASLTGASLKGANVDSAELSGIIVDETSFEEVSFGINSERNHIPVFSKSGNIDMLFINPPVSFFKVMIVDPTAFGGAFFKPKISKKQNFYHAPSEIAKAALTGVCTTPLRSIAAISFRGQYQGLQNEDNKLKTNKEYQVLLTDIDRKLCTLPECADIRDDIDGLDCQPFLKKSRKINK